VIFDELRLQSETILEFQQIENIRILEAIDQIDRAMRSRKTIYLISIDVQTDFIEIDFDVEHWPLKVLVARFHHQNDPCFDIQRSKN
jgi:hypothetical protein